MKISFIVIGRNEGFKLRKCFTSLKKLNSNQNLKLKSETIYVDSDSSDDSISIAKEHKINHIIKIKGNINAAIARNVGASYAKYDWLLFLDGDMELQESFFLDDHEDKFTDNDFFSGQFINYYYNREWNKISEDEFVPNPKTEKQFTPGGLFIVKNKIWKELNGMRDYYKRSQDFDFGLRCFKNGYRFTRYNQLLAIHHTISYLSNSRNLEFFKKGYYLYSRSLLYRDHIFTNFNRYCFKILIKQDYTLVFLFLSTISIPFLNLYAMLFYLLPFLYKVIKNRKNGLFFYTGYLIARDITVALGLLFFYPSKTLKYNIEYIDK